MRTYLRQFFASRYQDVTHTAIKAVVFSLWTTGAMQIVTYIATNDFTMAFRISFVDLIVKGIMYFLFETGYNIITRKA